MTRSQIMQRQRAVAAAIGSVRAEGMNPSVKTQKRLKEYAKGNLNASDVRASIIRDIKTNTSK